MLPVCLLLTQTSVSVSVGDCTTAGAAEFRLYSRGHYSAVLCTSLLFLRSAARLFIGTVKQHPVMIKGAAKRAFGGIVIGLELGVKEILSFVHNI